ncbi:MAG: hypothetical protein ACXWLI_09110 [Myxococcaceae bacterium]
MSRRPLVTVPALTLADLLLWHWSLAAHHEILALVSGLSLPPLLLASMWLVALACVQLLARGVRVPLTAVSRGRVARASARARELATPAAAVPTAHGPAATRSTAPRPAQVPVASADRKRPPRKLAA